MILTRTVTAMFVCLLACRLKKDFFLVVIIVEEAFLVIQSATKTQQIPCYV